ncbi:GNAT family N-acetyltransferase [Litchfieldia alkalitelluris]|uniref:GNAT family N-acetyltransferase n=1 Tax=Litchfieldia alkalitelluris TaxID=304268 RepID=UPI002E270A05
MKFPIIDTERLYLRELKINDREAVFKHFAEEAVTKFMDISPCSGLLEAEEIIQFHLDDSGCRWGIFDKIEDTLIGTCGYHCWDSNSIAKAEIGFDLSESFWGNGYMTEAIYPVIQFGFKQMNLQLIEATVVPNNEKSIKLLEKLGFKRKEELVNGLMYFYLTNENVDY